MPTIQSDGVTVNYHDVGSGEPIVLIHCSSSSHRQWRALWEMLEDEYRLLATDMLDWGGTDAWPDHEGSLLEDEVKLIHAVTQGIDNYHLVGHSYGGTVAYHLAMTSPEKVKTLTLIEPMLGWLLDNETDADIYNDIRHVAEYFWQKYLAGAPEEGIQHYFDYWNGPGAWEFLDEGLAEYVLAGAHKNSHEFKAIFEGGDGLAPPEQFQAPTLLLAGEKTNKPPLRVLELLESKFPNAQRKLVEGAGHMSPITHSDQVNAIIKEFIGG